MKCSNCGGLVMWVGPLTNLGSEGTKCIACGGRNCQEIEPSNEPATDPYESKEYEIFVQETAKDCVAENKPCDSCLAGGICDGHKFGQPERENDTSDYCDED